MAYLPVTMHVLFVAGGSVGHTAPAVAVWQALKDLQPDATAFFICAPRKDECEFLQKERIVFYPLPIPRIGVALPWNFVRALFGTWNIMKEEKPDAVFSKGGALSVPVCLAAWLRGIPIVLHESDAVMGTANRVIAKIAKKICVGMEAPREEKSPLQTSSSTLNAQRSKLMFTGNPVRPMMREGKKEEGLRITGYSGAKPILCINGGSQGAQVLNEWLIAHIDALLPLCDVIHITGRGKTGAPEKPGYWHREFVVEELPHLYAITTLAVTRAGAGTISELAATGVPAVLVPLPGLAHDHQLLNARLAAASGGCIVTPQEGLSDHLFPAVTSLLADGTACTEMSARMHTLDVPSASRQIAEVIVSCLAPSARGA